VVIAVSQNEREKQDRSSCIGHPPISKARRLCRANLRSHLSRSWGRSKNV